MRSLILLVASAATAHADASYSIDAGISSRDARPAAAFSLAAGVDVATHLQLELRGHAVIGNGVITALGPAIRCDHGSWLFGFGLAIAHVLGPPGDDRVDGLGLAADPRIGYRIGVVTVAVHAMPIWVFANDSPTTAQHDAFELGVSLGITSRVLP